jgi:hypothetical protein
MTSIKSLFMPCIEVGVSPQYIAKVLREQKLATVSRITLVPYVSKGTGKTYQRGFVDISEWHDNEASYNLIKRIKNAQCEARVVFEDPKWWAVRENRNRNITSSPKYVKNTSTFNIWDMCERDKCELLAVLDSAIDSAIDRVFDADLERELDEDMDVLLRDACVGSFSDEEGEVDSIS